jgi:hypothetical protein
VCAPKAPRVSSRRLVQSQRYNITLAMFHMTTHERALPQHAHADAPAAGPGVEEARLSALGASAGARLSVAAALLVALWAGAYWALH